MKTIYRLLVILGISLTAATAHAAEGRLNVVVFVADDLGARDLGFTGSTFYESPNIDALAKRGAVFTQAYSAGPVCSPTRAALMSGRYPARVRVTDYIGGPQPEQARTMARYRNRSMLPAPYQKQLALEEVTLGEAFKEAGYATMYAGKWHLGGAKFSPEEQGFETVFSFGPQGGPGKAGYFEKRDGEADANAEGDHLDLRLARDTAGWIAQQAAQKKPFLAYFAPFDVHVPLMAPKETVAYFEAKREKLKLNDEFGEDTGSKVRLTQAHAVYAGMVKTLDDAVGIVVKQLEAEGLMDETIILFTSDNGGLSTAEGSPTSNLPLRAGKGWAYEGGVRVPQVMILPGVTRAGQHCDALTTSTDVFPTLLEACGLPLRETAHVDGKSILPALRGEKPAEREIFWHYPHYGNQGGVPYSAVRSGSMKLVVFHDPARGIELYDLAADPHEKNNLAEGRADEVKALRDKLGAWKASVGAVDATLKTPQA